MNYTTASELGYLNVPENTLIEIDQLKNYPPEKTVLITTGSQGKEIKQADEGYAKFISEKFKQALSVI